MRLNLRNLTLLVVFSFSFASHAQENFNRILIAGDSWAAFPCEFKSMEKMIELRQVNLINDSRCTVTSKLGMRAMNWIDSEQDAFLSQILSQDQRIKILFLSLGGNDVLDRWSTQMSQNETDELLSEISQKLNEITQKYLAINPNLKIIISGYDFTNFRYRQYIPMYRKMYRHLGEPTPHEINLALVAFSQHMAHLSDRKNIFYINHLGLGHYYNGVPGSTLRLDITLSPNQFSTFDHPETYGGNVYYSNSDESMMIWGNLLYDAIHLSPQNYVNVMLHTFDNILVHIL